MPKLTKYKLFSHGTYGGTIETRDIHGFIRDNYYPDIPYSVDEEEKEVYLRPNMIKVMEFIASKLGQEPKETRKALIHCRQCRVQSVDEDYDPSQHTPNCPECGSLIWLDDVKEIWDSIG